mmetsp:Transcript_24076/g.54776  ORF Transcript_24076/g.54776 Transcript_24076/m.54776 type:complete len:201 (-) Transcript_24076:45-647(-)
MGSSQDLLMDVLLSTLYGRPIAYRKIALARNEISRRGGKGGGSAELPSLLQSGKQLGALEVRQVSSGVVVSSHQLTVLLSDGKMVVAHQAPCQKCSRWSLADTYALHCLAKKPWCLDLAQCACLQPNAREANIGAMARMSQEVIRDAVLPTGFLSDRFRPTKPPARWEPRPALWEPRWRRRRAEIWIAANRSVCRFPECV